MERNPDMEVEEAEIEMVPGNIDEDMEEEIEEMQQTVESGIWEITGDHKMSEHMGNWSRSLNQLMYTRKWNDGVKNMEDALLQ